MTSIVAPDTSATIETDRGFDFRRTHPRGAKSCHADLAAIRGLCYSVMGPRPGADESPSTTPRAMAPSRSRHSSIGRCEHLAGGRRAEGKRRIPSLMTKTCGCRVMTIVPRQAHCVSDQENGIAYPTADFPLPVKRIRDLIDYDRTALVGSSSDGPAR